MEYEILPGEKLNNYNYKGNQVLISVVIPFYNDKEYIEQTVYSVLNQSFPFFELLIIDDGSTDKDSLNLLKKIEKLDKRIKIFHKENEGLAATRDFGASNSSNLSKYLFFIDADDLIGNTYLECAYYTLETHQEATWCYSNVIGFGNLNYKWAKWFNSFKMKHVNELISANFIRKSDFVKYGGYGIKEKAVNEDWILWLKLLSEKRYPVHMSFYGLYYRRKENGELKAAIANRKKTLSILKKYKKKIRKDVPAVQYPLLIEEKNNVYKFKNESIQSDCKTVILLFDNFEIDTINEYKQYDKIIVINTNPTDIKYSYVGSNIYIYNLSSFIDRSNWNGFLHNLKVKENNAKIINVNCDFSNNAFKQSENSEEKIHNIQKYELENYGKIYTDNNGKVIYNYKKELLGNKLWKYKLWRKFVKILKQIRRGGS